MGFTIKFFKRFYMRTNDKYDGPLTEPSKISILFKLTYLQNKTNLYKSNKNMIKKLSTT